MERFICAGGAEHGALSMAEQSSLKLAEPEEFHFSPQRIMEAGIQRAADGIIRLPFCSCLSCDGLGGHPVLTCSGAYVKESVYAASEELPAHFDVSAPRIAAMAAAVKELSAKGFCVSWGLEGPMTMLATVLPLQTVYKALLREEDNPLWEKAEQLVMEYAALVAESGAGILSLADPVATADLLGKKRFRTVSGLHIAGLVQRVQKQWPEVTVHLCGKLTQDMLDAELCRVEQLSFDDSCETYGRALRYYADSGIHKRVVGHFCLNRLSERRPQIRVLHFGTETGEE